MNYDQIQPTMDPDSEQLNGGYTTPKKSLKEHYEAPGGRERNYGYSERIQNIQNSNLSLTPRPFTQMIDAQIASERGSEGTRLRSLDTQHALNNNNINTGPPPHWEAHAYSGGESLRGEYLRTVGPLQDPIMSSTQRSHSDLLSQQSRTARGDFRPLVPDLSTSSSLYSHDNHNNQPAQQAYRVEFKPNDNATGMLRYSSNKHSERQDVGVQKKTMVDSPISTNFQDHIDTGDYVEFYKKLTPKQRKKELVNQKEALIQEQQRLKVILTQQEALLEKKQRQLHLQQKTQRDRMHYFEKKGEFPDCAARVATPESPTALHKGDDITRNSLPHNQGLPAQQPNHGSHPEEYPGLHPEGYSGSHPVGYPKSHDGGYRALNPRLHTEVYPIMNRGPHPAMTQGPHPVDGPIVNPASYPHRYPANLPGQPHPGYPYTAPPSEPYPKQHPTHDPLGYTGSEPYPKQHPTHAPLGYTGSEPIQGYLQSQNKQGYGGQQVGAHPRHAPEKDPEQYPKGYPRSEAYHGRELTADFQDEHGFESHGTGELVGHHDNRVAYIHGSGQNGVDQGDMEESLEVVGFLQGQDLDPARSPACAAGGKFSIYTSI